MDYRENSKKIVIILLIICSSGFIYSSINSFLNYNLAVENAEDLKNRIKIEMITITAPDGVDINAYLFVNNTNWEKTDSSVPMIICCHGMNGNPLVLKNLGYTLALRGYAALLPEYRGHQSNSAGLTFGSKEPWDIIGLMDYIETQDKFAFINNTNQAIIGTSLGGFMATSTYVFESLGKNRLRALVSLAGPLNVSRAIEFYTTTPHALGDSPFLGNLTGNSDDKNIINYINSTFPTNVLIRHGTNDTIVDFQCSVDFMNILNSTGLRTDIKYDVIDNAGHEVAGNRTSLKHAIAWVEKFIIFNDTNFEHVKFVESNFDTSYMGNFIYYLKIACYFLIFIIPFVIYLIKPQIFETKRDEEIEEIENVDELKEKNKLLTMKEIRNIVLIFFGLVFLAGIIALLFLRSDIVKELMLAAIFTSSYVLYLYYKKFPNNIKEWCKNSINPKISLIWIFSIVFSMGLYHIIPNTPLIQELTLSFGFRITWFTPFFIILIVISNISNMMFVRYLLSGRKFTKIRLIGPIFNGLLMLMTIFVFLFWDLNANLFGLPLAVLIALGLFLVYIIIDYLAQMGEILGKSVFISPIIVSLIISLLIFSNNDIFFFF
ncbi:MAG: prolyl oligopeptidase family serine peptidase [archaeon]|nr:prolyl oligopeptidase family serine peptidase [archaeon]